MDRSCVTVLRVRVKASIMVRVSVRAMTSIKVEASARATDNIRAMASIRVRASHNIRASDKAMISIRVRARASVRIKTSISARGQVCVTVWRPFWVSSTCICGHRLCSLAQICQA